MRLVVAVLLLTVAFALPAAATKLVPQTREQITFSYAPLVARVAPAVVNVYAARAVARPRSPFAGDPFFERFFEGARQPRERVARSLGSGVVVSQDGVIVTNVHVVQNADELRVATRDGREFEAVLVLADEASDIAVLKAKDGADFDFLELGDSDGLEVGDLVLAIGNPFGVGQTVTSGIVSGLARSRVGAGDFGFFIQTDASINPGNSGGALIDMRGRLVGINTAIFSRSGGSNGIGFAVPSNMARVVIDSAARGETSVARPRLGATFEAVSFEIAEALGLARPAGALVVDVEEGGPAEAAGLRSGDVILAFEGKPIEHLDALGYRLVTAGPEREVELTVLSRSDRRNVRLKLGKPAAAAPVVRIDGDSPLVGARVSALDATFARRLRHRGPGVVIVEVERGSRAAQAGLRERDILVAINGVALESMGVLQQVLADDPYFWRIDLVRNGRRIRSILR